MKFLNRLYDKIFYPGAKFYYKDYIVLKDGSKRYFKNFGKRYSKIKSQREDFKYLLYRFEINAKGENKEFNKEKAIKEINKILDNSIRDQERIWNNNLK